jgi:hypothetical protein
MGAASASEARRTSASFMVDRWEEWEAAELISSDEHMTTEGTRKNIGAGPCCHAYSGVEQA